MEHELKTDTEVFYASYHGLKPYEIRKDDRGFQVGHTVKLRETQYTGAEMLSYEHPNRPGSTIEGKPLMYTGREMIGTIVYILRGPIYGLAEGWVILTIEYGR